MSAVEIGTALQLRSVQHEVDHAEQLVRVRLSVLTLCTSRPGKVEPNAKQGGRSARSRQHSTPAHCLVWRPSMQSRLQQVFVCTVTGQKNAGASSQCSSSEDVLAKHHCL